MYSECSLVPRPLPDFILQLWRKTDFSPQLRGKMWEWPGNEATLSVGQCKLLCLLQ